jgi:WD40 repeat protein
VYNKYIYSYLFPFNLESTRMKPYKLMCSLFAHTSDVKGLCSVPNNNGFFSASRDMQVKLWYQNQTECVFILIYFYNFFVVVVVVNDMICS